MYANFEVDRMKHAGTTTNNRGVSVNLDKRTKLSTGERCLPTEGHLQIDRLPLSEATADHLERTVPTGNQSRGA